MVHERDIAVMRRLLNPDCEAQALTEQLLLRSEVSARQTRAVVNGQLQLPRVRTEFARRSFMYRAISAWNNMPGNIRQCSTANDRCRLVLLVFYPVFMYYCTVVSLILFYDHIAMYLILLCLSN